MKKNNYSTSAELTNLEKHVIRESEEELKRSRSWKRIFPSPHSIKYKNFFEVERPFNKQLLAYHVLDFVPKLVRVYVESL